MKNKYLIVFTFLIATFSFAQQKSGSIDKIIEEESSKIDKSELSASTSLPNSPTSVVTYDFTTSASKYYGGAAAAAILEINGADTTWGMIAGDGDGNGGINIDDRNLVWRVENGSIGYKSGDYDMNGGVNIDDRNLIWRINNGKISFVP